MNGMKPCKTCKNLIAKNAKVCPQCGAKQKGSLLLKIVAGFALLIGLGMALNDGSKGAALASGSNSSSEPANTVKVISLTEYKKDAKKMVFREAALKKIETDALLTFSSEVSQKVSDTEYLVFTNKNEYGYTMEERVYLEFNEKPEILEKDIIKVYGKYRGTKEYTTFVGASKEVPYIQAEYYEVQEKK